MYHVLSNVVWPFMHVCMLFPDELGESMVPDGDGLHINAQNTSILIVFSSSTALSSRRLRNNSCHLPIGKYSLTRCSLSVVPVGFERS